MGATVGTSGFGTLLKRGDGGVGAGTKASRTIGTSNQQIILRAKTAGVAGNSKTCSIVVSGNSTPFALSVSASNVTITAATNSGGTATTTVEDAIVQLYQDATFIANWEATLGVGDGSGILVAAASAALAGGADGTELFTAIAEVNGFTGPEESVDLIEATHMTSPSGYREYIPGLLDGGELNFSLNFLPGDVGHQALRSDLTSRTKRNFQIVWSDLAATTYQFAGYVTNISPSAQIDDKLSADVTVKITGAVSKL